MMRVEVVTFGVSSQVKMVVVVVILYYITVGDYSGVDSVFIITGGEDDDCGGGDFRRLLVTIPRLLPPTVHDHRH